MSKRKWHWENPWRKAEDGCDKPMGRLLDEQEGEVLWFGWDGEESIYCPKKEDALLIEAAPQLLEALKIISEGSLDGMKKWLIAHKAHEGISDFHAPLLMIRIAQTALIEVKK